MLFQYGTSLTFMFNTMALQYNTTMFFKVLSFHGTHVFSRRFSSEKCPTITVASFFISFFSSDYNLNLIGPPFLQSKLLKLLP